MFTALRRRRMRLRPAAVILFCAATLVCAASEAAPRTLGWLEWAWLEPGHIRIKTKLDTGARTSSIDARDIEVFTRNGKPWVRFRVPLAKRPDDSDHGQDVDYERQIVGEIVIKDHDSAGTTRYAVNIDVCVGGMTFTTPVTLANRRRFNYPLLLGRSALAGHARVDAARKFTASKSCPATDHR